MAAKNLFLNTLRHRDTGTFESYICPGLGQPHYPCASSHSFLQGYRLLLEVKTMYLSWVPEKTVPSPTTHHGDASPLEGAGSWLVSLLEAPVIITGCKF